MAQVSDLFPCDDPHKKNSIRLVERIPSMQISKVIRGNEMPTREKKRERRDREGERRKPKKRS